MPDISEIVDVSITRETQAVARSAFNVAITPVVFAVDSDTTMDAIATEFQSDAGIATAVATGSPKRVITITAAGDETAPIVITEEAVTLGASQANIAKARTPAVRTREYANITAVAVDFATTDPEYLAAASLFAQNPRKTGRTRWMPSRHSIPTGTL
jgi:hypothetical protein